jgi:hypothetical protein
MEDQMIHELTVDMDEEFALDFEVTINHREPGSRLSSAQLSPEIIADFKLAAMPCCWGIDE